MIVCGIDESGRGPLAGPLVVSAVIFEKGFNIAGIRDSKKLSHKSRNIFYDKIISNCIDYRIEVIDHNIIDEKNILKACMLGMKKCLELLSRKDFKLFVDGNYFKLENDYQNNFNFETVVHGDDLIFEISCASILAKVTRDKIMEDYHIKYPEYNFKKNKGYGTLEHINRIKEYGICEIHRKTFTAKFINGNDK